MDFLLEALTNWLKEMLVGGIMSNLSGMFDSVNQQVADISVQVGQTPQGWNGSIFNMIENLSNSIMVPIAGVILAIVMTVDLIQMIADKNNLHDVDTWMIFKWVFKSAAAILIVTNTWNIVMGVFDMAQSVVAQAAGIIGSDASIDISSVMTDLEPRLMWHTARRVTLRNSGGNMRKKFCSTRLLRMPLMRWASRSCQRSKSYRQSTQNCWKKRKRPMPSIGIPVRKCENF